MAFDIFDNTFSQTLIKVQKKKLNKTFDSDMQLNNIRSEMSYILHTVIWYQKWALDYKG